MKTKTLIAQIQIESHEGGYDDVPKVTVHKLGTDGRSVLRGGHAELPIGVTREEAHRPWRDPEVR